ncbi:NADPH-dependent FMN reductase [Bacillus infantis]|uniref:NADPH-dependent FMN reductase n=1 Tax=Bacillus infantis TaxID=324767 RepID=UPI003CF40678
MSIETLLVCGSMKPALGQNKTSAVREVLKVIKKRFTDMNYENYQTLDIRELNLPYFDGRNTEEYMHEGVTELYNAFLEAKTIVVSAPAYWRTVAGGLINALNLIGGPLYDFPDKADFLKGKEIFLITVGASFVDSVYASTQLRNSFSSMGASVSQKEIIIGNIREMDTGDQKKLSLDLYNLGTEILKMTEEYKGRV